MTEQIFKLPMYELTLQDAVFIHKDIIVFPKTPIQIDTEQFLNSEVEK